MRRLLVACTLLGVIVIAVNVGTRRHASEGRRVVTSRMALEDGVLRTVVLGDSVAYGAGDERGRGIPGALDEQLRHRGLNAAAVVNLGINGARTRDVRKLIERAAARAALRSADVIVISIGGNDLYGDSFARLLAGLLSEGHQLRTLARVQNVVGALRNINPAARIYVLGLYNPYRRSHLRAWLDRQVNLWDSRLIARFAAHRGVTVLRICDLLQRDDRLSTLDRFHPGATGYVAIADRIASSL